MKTTFQRIMSLASVMAILIPLFWFTACNQADKAKAEFADSVRVAKTKLAAKDSLKRVNALKAAKKNSFLSGTIFLDKACQRKTCESMEFMFKTDDLGSVFLNLLSYQPPNFNSQTVQQVPLDLAKDLEKVTKKRWPEAYLNSDGSKVNFLLFFVRANDNGKTVDVLDEARKLLKDLKTAFPRWEIKIERWTTPEF